MRPSVCLVVCAIHKYTHVPGWHGPAEHSATVNEDVFVTVRVGDVLSALPRPRAFDLVRAKKKQKAYLLHLEFTCLSCITLCSHLWAFWHVSGERPVTSTVYWNKFKSLVWVWVFSVSVWERQVFEKAYVTTCFVLGALSGRLPGTVVAQDGSWLWA